MQGLIKLTGKPGEQYDLLGFFGNKSIAFTCYFAAEDSLCEESMTKAQRGFMFDF